MKLLYINAYVPYPLNSGGNQAFFMMADHIRKHHELSLLLFVHNGKERKYVKELETLWPDVTFYLFEPNSTQVQIQVQDAYAHMSWFTRKSCKFFESVRNSMQRKIERREKKYALRQQMQSHGSSTQSPAVDFVKQHSTLFAYNGDLTSAFCQFVYQTARLGFDTIQVEFYEYLTLGYLLPADVKKVFVHHELRFVRNNNEIQLFQHPLAADYLKLEREKAQEIAALKVYDAVITLTDIDREILSHYLPQEKLFTSPAITQAVKLEHKPFTPAQDLIFVGGGDHFPNADAMVWFCSQVVPLLRQRLSVLPTLYVTGIWSQNLKDSIFALCPNVIFEGFIDDLSSFLNGKISIVPIRIGSGMRMKILDSIFAASPLVTTSKGCEGLPIENGRHCLIADTPETFAEALVTLLNDRLLQEQLAHNAQKTGTPMLNDTELFQRRLSVYEALTPKN